MLEARNHSDNPEEVDALGKRFEAYYAVARPVSLQLITGSGGDSVTSAVQRMTSDYNVLRAAIEANIRAQEQAIDAAFHAARALQLSATFGVAIDRAARRAGARRALGGDDAGGHEAARGDGVRWPAGSRRATCR